MSGLEWGLISDGDRNVDVPEGADKDVPDVMVLRGQSSHTYAIEAW